MQHTNPGDTWFGWSSINANADEATKLAALRELIVRDATKWVQNGEITAGWADKKLAKLGITDRIGSGNTYELEVTATGKFRMAVKATNRAEAESKFLAHLAAMNRAAISEPSAFALPVFVSGPADTDPTAPVDPTTVDDTLALFREIVMLAHIAGPHICLDGANDLLDDYGLAPVPPVRTFTVSRPVIADMQTTVQAFDMVSAARVASWRWEDGKSGYTMKDAEPTAADAAVAEVATS